MYIHMSVVSTYYLQLRNVGNTTTSKRQVIRAAKIQYLTFVNVQMGIFSYHRTYLTANKIGNVFFFFERV